MEPEPFEMGEHLVEASGKLHLLDRMLEFLHQGSVHAQADALYCLNDRQCCICTFVIYHEASDSWAMLAVEIWHSVEVCGRRWMTVLMCFRGHRVLLFSQFTRLLDILQDYMEYRGTCSSSPSI